MEDSKTLKFGSRSVRVRADENDEELTLDIMLEREINHIYSMNKDGEDILSMTITPRFEDVGGEPIEYWVVYTYKY